MLFAKLQCVVCICASSQCTVFFSWIFLPKFRRCMQLLQWFLVLPCSARCWAQNFVLGSLSVRDVPWNIENVDHASWKRNQGYIIGSIAALAGQERGIEADQTEELGIAWFCLCLYLCLSVSTVFGIVLALQGAHQEEAFPCAALLRRAAGKWKQGGL